MNAEPMNVALPGEHKEIPIYSGYSLGEYVQSCV